ncbi:ASI1-immunoprecipitated protein 1-like isoform X1 [Primulina eburnea]|uniref:ASI1-immunoprecipitated protein 1-like isoform X1 n=1 Tax=Primulina eburnea TaxID=1245227 RepID=UPI003C6C4EA3
MDAEESYASFLEKVKRTIYIDNMSPAATDSVVKAAFNQFGNVLSVHFIPNYLDPKNVPQAALVEMENPKQAEDIIAEMEIYPFMILGMPRPVRARPAKLEMFGDRPRKPGRRILCQWIDSKNPDFEVVQKIKNLVKTHAAEASFLLMEQLKEEEKLAAQQNETLKANYRKFELIDGVHEDGTAKKLAHYYNMRTSDS